MVGRVVRVPRFGQQLQAALEGQIRKPWVTRCGTIQHTRTFTATELYGKRYTIHVYKDRKHIAGFGGASAIVDGLNMLKTSDGLSVRRIAKGEYEIVQTGVRLRSTDPTRRETKVALVGQRPAP
jgi:hypothetical protein